jgi:hypothetical protein
MAIDTHGYVKAVESAGIDRGTAEAHLEAMIAHVLPHLTTKVDAKETETLLRSDLRGLRSDFKEETSDLKAKLLLVQWMLGFNLAATMAVLWKLLR